MHLHHTIKGLLLGGLGGIAGTLAMGLYWKAATALEGDDPRMLTRDDEADHPLDEMSVVGQQHQEDESSTEAVGRIAYEAVTGDEPESDEFKTTLSNTVHWSYGTLLGGLYGALRGRADAVDAPGGLAFGTAAWLLGDEVMVPLLGLSKGPTEYPAKQHAHRLGAHLVYGLAASVVTQALFGLLDRSHRTPLQRAKKTASTYLSPGKNGLRKPWNGVLRALPLS